MSKRSISKKINIDQLYDFPLPENLSLQKNDEFFGETISNSTDSSISNSDKFCTSSDQIQDSVSCSADSTTSCEDDLELEATKKVTLEFEKLNSLLYGERDCDAINYEHKQWTDKFPHLRVTGNAMKILPCTVNNNDENFGAQGDNFEEIIAEHSDCQYSFYNDKTDTKLKIKEAVINTVLKEVNTKLKNIKTSKQVNQIKIRPNRILLQTHDTKNIEVNEVIATSQNFFEVSTSAFRLTTSPFQQSNFQYQSPIMKSHLSASKWQKSDTLESTSLPCIVNSNMPYTPSGKRSIASISSNNSRTDLTLNRSATNTRNNIGLSKKYTSSKHLCTPRPTNVILPPIEHLKLDANKERAATATPRHNKISNRYALNSVYKTFEKQ